MAHSFVKLTLCNFLLILLVSSVKAIEDVDCVQDGVCKCVRKSDGYVLDLNVIAKKDGSPSFQVTDISDENVDYAWNPCYALNMCGDATDASACQIVKSLPRQYYSTGSISQTTFTRFPDRDSFGIRVQYGDSGRYSEIMLACEPTGTAEDTFAFLGESPSLQYNFILHSKAACFDGSGPKPPSGGGWSLGDILLLICFLLLILYVIAGFLFNIFYRKLTGVEIVPNHTFWLAVPGLIRDGCMFLVGLVKGRRTGYSEV